MRRMSESKRVCKEDLNREIEENRRMLVYNSTQSLGALTEKALLPMREEWEREERKREEAMEEGAWAAKA